MLHRYQTILFYQLPNSYWCYTQDPSSIFCRDQAHLTECSKPQNEINQLHSFHRAKLAQGSQGSIRVSKKCVQ